LCYIATEVITVPVPLPSRKQLERRYSDLCDSYDKLLHELQRRIRSALSSHELNATIKYRVKSFKSYYQKLRRLVRSNDPTRESVTITDLIAIRIVCPFLDEVAHAEGILAATFEVHELDRKGAEFSVREFGYESTHCLLRVPQDLCESFHLAGPIDCEIQLRTILQDAWAEVEHEIVYKSDFTPMDDSVQRKLAALNASLSLSDVTFQEIRNYQRLLTAELSRRREAFLDTVRRAPGDDAVPDLYNGGGAPTEPPVPAVTGGQHPNADGEDARSALTGNLDSELLAALKAHNSGDFARARRIYTKILETRPASPARVVLLLHRGMAELADDEYRAALQDFDAALDLDNTNSRAYFYRGTAYRALGDHEQAESDFSRSLDLDPHLVDCLHQRSALRLQTGNLDGAVSDCEAALAIEPDSPWLRRLSATIRERKLYGGED
jgi:putative GTP pyrophosphokinase